MADITPGKVHPVAKWSLIIGPLLAVIFNFLLPTNGIEPVNPEDSTAFITALGKDADLAQIYLVAILIGILLYTRAIIGLWRASPQGPARERMTVGVLAAVAALGLWGVVLGLGLAEAAVAEKVVTGNAAAASVAATLHAGFFGVYQIAVYVGYISLIPLGGGIAISGIVRKEFGWVIIAVGVATLVLTSIFPIKTEEGIMVFGIIAVVWALVFVAMGVQIMRQDMNDSAASEG